ncbi:MAG TPA: hypothetical protein VI408_12050 [Gaiellaceae bacterium]
MIARPCAWPAVCVADPVIVSFAAAAGLTVMVPVVPVIVPVTVSVAVIVRAPAWVRVAVKVLLPLSPATKA